MLVKIHETYRKTIAICDEEVLGKVFEEGEKSIDLTGKFFEGESKSEKELEEIVEMGFYEDATFYIVGESSIKFFKSRKLILDGGISKIDGVPIALILL